MTWDHRHAIALASQKCAKCYGLGTHPSRNGSTAVCHCVYRAIFRAVHGRWKKCVAKGAPIGQVVHERDSGARGKHGYGLRNAEFMADFILLAKRTLGEETPEYRLFKWSFLLGADWRLVLRKLRLRVNPHNRGQYFHAVYRIESRLGRAFAETQPYGLWPLDEYFGGAARAKKIEHPIFELSSEAVKPQRGKRLRFPLRAKAA